MNGHFESAGQVRLLFDQVRNQMPPEVDDQIRSMAKEGPELKRQQYSGGAYLDQVEKNAVYLREGTMAVNAAITEYLMHGQPILSPEEIPAFLTYTRVTRPQQTVLLHLNFIRNGCSGCDVHDEHGPYAAFRQLLLTGDSARYIDEMEFSYVYFQASCLVAQQFLVAMLSNYGLAGCARLISAWELAEVVQERVFRWTDVCLGNIQPVAPQETQFLQRQQFVVVTKAQ